MRNLKNCPNDEIKEEIIRLHKENEVITETRDLASKLGCLEPNEKKVLDESESINKLQIALLSRILELREKENIRRFSY